MLKCLYQTPKKIFEIVHWLPRQRCTVYFLQSWSKRSKIGRFLTQGSFTEVIRSKKNWKDLKRPKNVQKGPTSILGWRHPSPPPFHGQSRNLPMEIKWTPPLILTTLCVWEDWLVGRLKSCCLYCLFVGPKLVLQLQHYRLIISLSPSQPPNY